VLDKAQRIVQSIRAIGVDFDNTIVQYDALFYRIAISDGLVNASHPIDKTAIRETIRTLEDGEMQWRTLQAKVYGQYILEAHASIGMLSFFRKCREVEVPVYVVSHKSAYSANAPEPGGSPVNLRDAAWKWLEQQEFFDKDQIGLERGHVFFESKRVDKISRLIQLNCDFFIDDLEETFLEPYFPNAIHKILYSKNEVSKSLSQVPNLNVIADWTDIEQHILG